MIKLTKSTTEKRTWDLKLTKSGKKDIECELNLISSSLSNRFDLVQNLFVDINKLVVGFSGWFYDLFKTYVDSQFDSSIIENSVDKFIYYSKKYVTKKQIDFESFINLKKVSKTSVVFYPKDIEDLAIASTALKLYSIFCYDRNLKVPENTHRMVYNYFMKDCMKNGVADKIFEIIKARTYRSTITDKYMWGLIKITNLETPETNVMTVFNFLMNNLIVLLDITFNPVPYIIKIADDSIKFMVRETFKEKIIYGENLSCSEDIYGSSLSKDSFNIYCCNDLLSKCANSGMKMIEDEFGDNYDLFIDCKERLDTVKKLDSAMKLFHLPVIGKVLDIPFNYLLTSPPKHMVIISYFIYNISRNILGVRFPILYEFLTCYPKNFNTQLIRSSYKIRNIYKLLEDDNRIFGINSRKIKYEIISPICGVLSINKKHLYNIITDKEMKKITYVDLENDVVSFYNSFLSGGFDSKFEKISELVDKYI